MSPAGCCRCSMGSCRRQSPAACALQGGTCVLASSSGSATATHFGCTLSTYLSGNQLINVEASLAQGDDIASG